MPLILGNIFQLKIENYIIIFTIEFYLFDAKETYKTLLKKLYKQFNA